ncbi:hypothetical protein Rsub_10889 [Raphidocelis subcapitata]|uniref:Uncharacterized protein n=1 Tax=Raphidocelis subcapitata TaxID=307507 RepID=A0A2V0PL35_9CHLO|nr:hypothetical protein Rsub_10889 [Raphidocelis subcapitata]|eukprot:GBF97725.1 hypothetical protein Rsub_10889 [Raphidocelis subcapitata]
MAGALGLAPAPSSSGSDNAGAGADPPPAPRGGPPASTSAPASLDVASLLEAIDAAEALCARRLCALAAARRGSAGELADPAALRAAAAAMAAHAAALRRVVASKHAIADRLRASKLRPSVPVEPEAQPAFDALLRAGAGGRALLDHGAAALGWAAALDAAPSCWEDTLRGVPDGARACRAHLAALSAFGAALAAAGGGGGGQVRPAKVAAAGVGV